MALLQVLFEKADWAPKLELWSKKMGKDWT